MFGPAVMIKKSADPVLLVHAPESKDLLSAS